MLGAAVEEEACEDMFEDLTAKDWITFAFSAAGLLTGGSALIITALRERRDREAVRPRLDVTLPPLDGPGPWEAQFELRNRSDGPILLRHITLRAAEPVALPLLDGGRITDVIEPAKGPFGRQRTGFGVGQHFDRVIKAGEAYGGTLRLGPNGGRVGNACPITFHAEYVEQGKTERVQRLARTITANP